MSKALVLRLQHALADGNPERQAVAVKAALKIAQAEKPPKDAFVEGPNRLRSAVVAYLLSASTTPYSFQKKQILWNASKFCEAMAKNKVALTDFEIGGLIVAAYARSQSTTMQALTAVKAAMELRETPLTHGHESAIMNLLYKGNSNFLPQEILTINVRLQETATAWRAAAAPAPGGKLSGSSPSASTVNASNSFPSRTKAAQRLLSLRLRQATQRCDKEF